MPTALTLAVSAQCKDDAQADAVVAAVTKTLIELKAIGVNVTANEHRARSGTIDLTAAKTNAPSA